MRPAPFSYARPPDLDTALRLLQPGSRVLAGGQSLLPQLNRRRTAPATLIDVSGLAGLRYVRRDPLGALSIGALARHADIERHTGPAIGSGYGVLREAAALIGHLPVRVRGTIGGSLAHGDPTAEWGLVAVGLDAQVTLRSAGGTRVVPAVEFLTGAFRTDLRPGEMLTEVRFPRPAPAAAVVEHAPQAGHFPVVAAFAAVDLAADGSVRAARVAVSGLGDR
ncbi:FAD binding domain-containing protein, partial [Actinoplanes sp. NPDC049596]